MDVVNPTSGAGLGLGGLRLLLMAPGDPCVAERDLALDVPPRVLS